MTTTDRTVTPTDAIRFDGRLTILPELGLIGGEEEGGGPPVSTGTVPMPPRVEAGDRHILLSRLAGRSLEEIAIELNLPTETVARRVEWLRDQLTAVG